MANPQDTGDFEKWIADRIDFSTIHPKTGDTGDFEKWIGDRIDFEDYVEAGIPTVIVVTTFFG